MSVFTKNEIDAMRRKLTHGFPVTTDQQKRLFNQAFGEKIETKKRCDDCGGEGKVKGVFSINDEFDCATCLGSGFKKE